MKPGALWPLAIVGVLTVMVGANVAVVVATHDPHVDAIEPDYYEKATAWDTTMARARANVTLGWQADASLRGWTPAGTPLVVAVADSLGRPITAAGVHVELIDNLAPDRPLRVLPREDAPGRYCARVPLPRPGLWILRVQVRRDSTYFSAELRREATR